MVSDTDIDRLLLRGAGAEEELFDVDDMDRDLATISFSFSDGNSHVQHKNQVYLLARKSLFCLVGT
jgi:hypothetical protein